VQTEIMANEHSIEKLAKSLKTSVAALTKVIDDLELVHEDDMLLASEEELAFIKDMLGSRDPNTLYVSSGINPRDLAGLLGVPVPDVLKNLMIKLKQPAQMTTSLKNDVVEKLAELYSKKVSWENSEPVVKPAPIKKAEAPKSGAVIRPPVVTIMGHVDHGKTSLLDYIRKANVASGEAGGITQHIGAYQVNLPQGTISFLDTPGHAAFTAMRARGAQVTDIAILVVAADDGIMPQSIEAIDHIRNAKVPMIVAVNKIDKPGSNPDKVLQQLMQHNVVVESYGGDTISVPVSALTGEGVPNLLELILLQAEVMELKADPKGEVDGVVVEAKLDKGRGPVCTLLVMSGTLKIGDSIVVGQCHGKIKAMTDYTGERMNAAGPSTPVEVLGLNEVPSAGDRIIVAADERAARNLAEERAMKARSKQLDGGRRRMSLKDLRKHLDDGEMRSLNLVVKADVQGSVEAVKGLLEKVANEEVEVKVVAANVGSITESDVLLASASDAIIVGFNAKPEGKAKAEAEKHRVEIRTYSIIYELIEDIEAAVKGMLAPKFEEQARGSAEIRAVFKLTKAGFVAGSYVTEGTLKRGGECRVFRNKELVYTGKVDSLKHIKADVREMNMGQECGIQFDGWTAFQEGDIVEAFEMVQIMD
jgi:translation initiation factor IF-2